MLLNSGDWVLLVAAPRFTSPWMKRYERPTVVGLWKLRTMLGGVHQGSRTRSPVERPRGEPVGEEVPPVDRVAVVEEEAFTEERDVAVDAGLLARGAGTLRELLVEDRPSHLRHEEVLQLGLDRVPQLLQAEVP